MRVAAGIMQPSILLVSPSASGAAAYRKIFTTVGWSLATAPSIAKAVEAAGAQLPHVVIADIRLPDGHVNALQDELRKSPLLRRIPLVVNLADERAADRVALSNRRYAAFFAGEPQPKACILKIREVQSAQTRPSPYFFAASRVSGDAQARLELSAKLVGSYGDYVALQAPLRLSSAQTLELAAGGVAMPIMPSGIVSRRLEGGGFLNFLPRGIIGGLSGPVLAKLTPLALSQDGKAADLGAPRDRRVLIYHPDAERGKRFAAALESHGVSAVLVRELIQAVRRLVAEPFGYGCVFLFDLLGEGARKDWTDTFNGMPVASRPGLLVGTQGPPPPSNDQVVFLKRPLEMPDLLRSMDLLLDRAREQQGTLSISVKAGGAVPVSLAVGAEVVGLDEQGGILELHGAIAGGGVGGMLTAGGFGRVWTGPQLVRLEGGGTAPDKPFVWQQRFVLGGRDDRAATARAVLAAAQGDDEPGDAPPETAVPEADGGGKAPGKGPGTAFDAKVINFFIQSCYEVIEYYCGELPQLGKPFLKGTKTLPTDFITGASTVGGKHVRGSTKLSCERAFVALLADRITGTPPYEAARDDQILAEVLTKLCDQVFGKARILLETAGLEYEVSLPAVEVAAAGAPSAEPVDVGPVMIIPFALHAAKFLVEVCFAAT